jgi:hypothetical protein
MVTATMKPTMQTATLMEVTVVEGVPTKTIVQIVSVMQSLRLIPIVSKQTSMILYRLPILFISVLNNFIFNYSFLLNPKRCGLLGGLFAEK